MTISNFEDLSIWNKARELSELIFGITTLDPFSKDFRFKDQIRAASGSVMDNIAEGFEREGNKEFIQFLYISKGSCGEVRSQSYRAFDNNYINEEQLNELLEKTKNLSIEIANFIKYLRNSGIRGNKYK
ncbi:MAG: four helix bundle protein [Bacteroidetes bacterium]|jgi:four helix bundle protein|nr:four helix bundle protein [Bacteroidota bacterium]